MSGTAQSAPSTTLIKRPLRYYGSRGGRLWADFGELWRFRELIWTFAVRDLKVRYRQTAVGVAWAVIQPLLTMVVFGALFTLIKGKPQTSNLPYAVTSMCGLVPWQLFAATVLSGTQSVVNNAQLLQKVYFPRIALAACLLDSPRSLILQSRWWCW